MTLNFSANESDKNKKQKIIIFFNHKQEKNLVKFLDNIHMEI